MLMQCHDCVIVYTSDKSICWFWLLLAGKTRLYYGNVCICLYCLYMTNRVWCVGCCIQKWLKVLLMLYLFTNTILIFGLNIILVSTCLSRGVIGVEYIIFWSNKTRNQIDNNIQMPHQLLRWNTGYKYNIKFI